MRRDEMWHRRPIACLFLVVGMSVVAIAEATAECAVPEYRRVRNYVNAEADAASVFISVPPEAFTIGNLVCLAQSFELQPEWKELIVWIFSSDDAALNYDPSPMTPRGVGFTRQLRAMYSVNVVQHENELWITPLGLVGNELYETRIELPVTTTPRCRLELSGRCVLAVEPFTYPNEARTARGAGTVLVTGTIGRDGKIMVARTVSRLGLRHPLVLAAANNLKMWWLEPAAREDTFQITYSYVIDSSVQSGKADMRLSLPFEVEIRTAPRE